MQKERTGEREKAEAKHMLNKENIFKIHLYFLLQLDE